MIPRLTRERAAMQFRQKVYGLLNVMEQFIEELSDPASEWSADHLTYIHFSVDKEQLSAFMSDPENVKTLQAILPAEADHLMACATELITELDALHTVRQDLIKHHLRPDGQDIQEHHVDLQGVGRTTVQDRAAANGLTANQQALLESHLTKRGHLLLSSAERDTLRTALLQALEPLSNQ